MKKQILISCIAAVLCFALGLGSMALVRGTFSEGNTGENETDEREDVVLEVMNMTEGITVTGRSFYPDYKTLSEKLMLIRYGLQNGILNDETLASELESAKRELEQLGYYYDYIGKTSITSENGTVYGAGGGDDAGGPIGGGEGYSEIFGSGIYDYLIHTDEEFYQALTEVKEGQTIYISKKAVIDLTDLQITNFPDVQIPDGITIASARGDDKTSGGVLKLSLDLMKLFSTASNVRLTGLVIEGPDAATHEGQEGYSVSNGIELKGTGIEIDNCEISGFSGAGLLVTEGDAYIHHCYIHHIRGNGAGNGILVTGGKARVEYNLFSNCRNAVTVNAGADLEASNNVEVGNTLEAMFRLGSADEGAAGSVVLKNNTVLGATLPVILEGTPRGYVLENNLFSLNDTQYDAALFYGPEENREALKAVSSVKNNVFNIVKPYLLTWNDLTETGSAS